MTKQKPERVHTRDQVNVRISDDAIAILYALQDYYGISQAALFEILLRDKARSIHDLKINPLVHQRTNAPRPATAARASSSNRPGTWGSKDSPRRK